MRFHWHLTYQLEHEQNQDQTRPNKLQVLFILEYAINLKYTLIS
jgi:hypothetical protein